MHVMTILGSPRRHGNTAKVLDWIQDQFRVAGHQIDAVNILDHNLRGCGECLACKRGTVELCSIDDDANGLFRRMVGADLVLIAAPVFCWGFPAQIKGIIDRLFCMMDFEGERRDVPRLYNKPMALLLTGGGEETNNADLVVRGFRHLVEYLKGRMVGYLFVSGCTTPEEMTIDMKTRAVEFANVIGGRSGRVGSPSK